MDSWIEAVVNGPQTVELIWHQERLLGAGYEFDRARKALVHGKEVHWRERVQVIRSTALAHQRCAHLQQRLTKATEELKKLTPEPGRGKRQYQDEPALKEAIEHILSRYQVSGFLEVSYQKEHKRLSHYVGRGRGGPDRPKVTKEKVRLVITEITRNEIAIENQKHRLGWRAQVTNMPKAPMPLDKCVIHYRGGWCHERDFHLLKDRPLGLRPLYVQKDDQIVGLTRLLTIALRVLTCMETRVRKRLVDAKQQLVGLYPGQPHRKTDRPTARRILKAVARSHIVLTRVEIGEQQFWHLTPLSDLVLQILSVLGVAPAIYKRLIENSS